MDECDDNDDEDKHYHYVLYQKVSRFSNVTLVLGSNQKKKSILRCPNNIGAELESRNRKQVIIQIDTKTL